MAEATAPEPPIHCEGCDTPIPEVTDAHKYPVPANIAALAYGQAPGVLNYICCPPLPDRTTPCLYAAIVADVQEYERAPCAGVFCTCNVADRPEHLAAWRRVQAQGGKLLP